MLANYKEYKARKEAQQKRRKQNQQRANKRSFSSQSQKAA